MVCEDVCAAAARMRSLQGPLLSLLSRRVGPWSLPVRTEGAPTREAERGVYEGSSSCGRQRPPTELLEARPPGQRGTVGSAATPVSATMRVGCAWSSGLLRR